MVQSFCLALIINLTYFWVLTIKQEQFRGTSSRKYYFLF